MGNFVGDLFQYYKDGGYVMHGISVLSLVSVTAIIYKLVVFRRLSSNVSEFIARVRSALLKTGLTVPVVGGRLQLGTWQQIVAINFDNRTRERELLGVLIGT